MSEPNELVNGYDPADPPHVGRWCSKCEAWDEACICDMEPEEYPPEGVADCGFCGATARFEGQLGEKIRAFAWWTVNHGCNYGRLLLTDRTQ